MFTVCDPQKHSKEQSITFFPSVFLSCLVCECRRWPIVACCMMTHCSTQLFTFQCFECPHIIYTRTYRYQFIPPPLSLSIPFSFSLHLYFIEFLFLISPFSRYMDELSIIQSMLTKVNTQVRYFDKKCITYIFDTFRRSLFAIIPIFVRKFWMVHLIASNSSPSPSGFRISCSYSMPIRSTQHTFYYSWGAYAI